MLASSPPCLTSYTWGLRALALCGKRSANSVLLPCPWGPFPRGSFWLSPWRAGFFFPKIEGHNYTPYLSHIPQDRTLHQCTITVAQATSNLDVTDKLTCIGDHQALISIMWPDWKSKLWFKLSVSFLCFHLDKAIFLLRWRCWHSRMLLTTANVTFLCPSHGLGISAEIKPMGWIQTHLLALKICASFCKWDLYQNIHKTCNGNYRFWNQIWKHNDSTCWWQGFTVSTSLLAEITMY